MDPSATCHMLEKGYIWVFPKIGVPQNGWFIMESPIKMDDLGGTIIFGNTHIYIYRCTVHGMASDQGQWCHRVRPRPKFLQNDEKRLHATCHVYKFHIICAYLWIFPDIHAIRKVTSPKSTRHVHL